MNRREQGDFGELSAAGWFVEQGAYVALPFGHSWLIPADRVEGGTGLMLGGPKYERYEVEPGRPFAVTLAG